MRCEHNENQKKKELAFADAFENTDRLKLLLCHIPTAWIDWEYMNKYPVDVVFSGHYHGGLVCLPGIGSVVSPQFELFPKYSFGMYEEAGKTAITSRGLGTHTFHIRICNRAELVNIVIHGKK